MPDTGEILAMMAQRNAETQALLSSARQADAFMQGGPYRQLGAAQVRNPSISQLLDASLPYEATHNTPPPPQFLQTMAQPTSPTMPTGMAKLTNPWSWLGPQTPQTVVQGAAGVAPFLASGVQLGAYTSLLTKGIGGSALQMTSPLSAGIVGGVGAWRAGASLGGVAMGAAVPAAMAYAGGAAVKAAYGHYVAEPLRMQAETEGLMRRINRDHMPMRMGTGFSQDEMSRVGTKMRDVVRDHSTRTDGVLRTFSQAQNFMAAGVGAGMYQDVRGVDEFEKRFAETLDAAKRVAKVLSTTVEKGVGFIKEAEQFGVYNKAQAPAFYSALRGASVGGMLSTSATFQLAGAGKSAALSLGGGLRGASEGFVRHGGSINAASLRGDVDLDRLRDGYGGIGREAAAVQYTTRTAQAASRLLAGGRGRHIIAGLMNESGTGVDDELAQQFASGVMSSADLLRRGRSRMQDQGAAAQLRLYQGELASDLLAKVNPYRVIGAAAENRFGRTGDPMVRRLRMQRMTGLSARELEVGEGLSGADSGMLNELQGYIQQDLAKRGSAQTGRDTSLMGLVKEAFHETYQEQMGDVDRAVTETVAKMGSDIQKFVRRKMGVKETSTVDITQSFATGMAARAGGLTHTAAALLGPGAGTMPGNLANPLMRETGAMPEGRYLGSMSPFGGREDKWIDRYRMYRMAKTTVLGANPIAAVTAQAVGSAGFGLFRGYGVLGELADSGVGTEDRWEEAGLTAASAALGMVSFGKFGLPSAEADAKRRFDLKARTDPSLSRAFAAAKAAGMQPDVRAASWEAAKVGQSRFDASVGWAQRVLAGDRVGLLASTVNAPPREASAALSAMERALSGDDEFAFKALLRTRGAGARVAAGVSISGGKRRVTGVGGKSFEITDEAAALVKKFGAGTVLRFGDKDAMESDARKVYEELGIEYGEFGDSPEERARAMLGENFRLLYGANTDAYSKFKVKHQGELVDDVLASGVMSSDASKAWSQRVYTAMQRVNEGLPEDERMSLGAMAARRGLSSRGDLAKSLASPIDLMLEKARYPEQLAAWRQKRFGKNPAAASAALSKSLGTFGFADNGALSALLDPVSAVVGDGAMTADRRSAVFKEFAGFSGSGDRSAMKALLFDRVRSADANEDQKREAALMLSRISTYERVGESMGSKGSLSADKAVGALFSGGAAFGSFQKDKHAYNAAMTQLRRSGNMATEVETALITDLKSKGLEAGDINGLMNQLKSKLSDKKLTQKELGDLLAGNLPAGMSLSSGKGSAGPVSMEAATLKKAMQDVAIGLEAMRASLPNKSTPGP